MLSSDYSEAVTWIFCCSSWFWHPWTARSGLSCHQRTLVFLVRKVLASQSKKGLDSLPGWCLCRNAPWSGRCCWSKGQHLSFQVCGLWWEKIGRGRVNPLTLRLRSLSPSLATFLPKMKAPTTSPHLVASPPPFPGTTSSPTCTPVLRSDHRRVPPVASAEGAHSSHSHFLLLALREEQSLWVPWDPHVAHRMRRHLLQEEPRGVETSITLSLSGG